MKIVIEPEQITVWVDSGIHFRTEGGTLYVNDKLIAKVSVSRPNTTYVVFTEINIPWSGKRTEWGNKLSEVADWVARHPEAVNPTKREERWSFASTTTNGAYLRRVEAWVAKPGTQARAKVMAKARQLAGRMHLPMEVAARCS